MSFAGTQFIVELGHGEDYAWSATSADSDLVDTVMERLCNPTGTTATVNSTHYLANGTCVPIDALRAPERRRHPDRRWPDGQPGRLRFNVYKTDHGIVTFRTLAKDPVAHKTSRSLS